MVSYYRDRPPLEQLEKQNDIIWNGTGIEEMDSVERPTTDKPF